MESGQAIDIGYKYPFSAEAKQAISEMSIKSFNSVLANLGKIRVQEALSKSEIEYFPTPLMELKKKYIASYAYARMIVSAIGTKSAVMKYAKAEARRCRNALLTDTPKNVSSMCAQLGLEVKPSGGAHYKIGLYGFLNASAGNEDIKLVNQQVESGRVYLSIDKLARLAEGAIAKETAKGLPASQTGIPKEIFDISRSIYRPEAATEKKEGGSSSKYRWIEKLLENPIPDVRHRTVNLILSPYFVNVLKMDEEKATKEIVSYIERCKDVNPDTNVDERYIKYQCSYAKRKGLSPLSFTKARDLLGHVTDIADLRPSSTAKTGKGRDNL